MTIYLMTSQIPCTLRLFWPLSRRPRWIGAEVVEWLMWDVGRNGIVTMGTMGTMGTIEQPREIKKKVLKSFHVVQTLNMSSKVLRFFTLRLFILEYRADINDLEKRLKANYDLPCMRMRIKAEIKRMRNEIKKKTGETEGLKQELQKEEERNRRTKESASKRRGAKSKNERDRFKRNRSHSFWNTKKKRASVAELTSSVFRIDRWHIVMHRSIWVSASKIVLASAQGLFWRAGFATSTTRIPALRSFEVLAKSAHSIVVHAFEVSVACCAPACVAALDRVRIPVNVGRIRRNLVWVAIIVDLDRLWFGKDLWNSMTPHEIGILHVSIPAVFRVLDITLVTWIVDTVPRIMSLRQAWGQIRKTIWIAGVPGNICIRSIGVNAAHFVFFFFFFLLSSLEIGAHIFIRASGIHGFQNNARRFPQLYEAYRVQLHCQCAWRL